MAELIRLASSSAGIGWWLGIDAEPKDSSKPTGADNPYKANAILLNIGDASTGAAAVRAAFAESFDIPFSLVEQSGAPPQLQLKSVGAGDIEKALLDEVRRRLGTQEIVWSQADSAKTFLKLPRGLNADAAGNFRGDARIYAASIGTAGNPVIAEFSARAALQMKVEGKAGNQITASRVFAIVLVMHDNAIPKLRVDLDDFNIGFPEIDFPDLDLSVLRKLPWPNLSGAARMFQRLASTVGDAVDVIYTTTAAEPTLRIDPTGADLKWCLAETSQDNAPPAKFGVTVKLQGLGTQLAKITGLSAEGTGSSGTLTGKVTIGGGINLPDGQRKFGPLVARWNGVTLTPTADASIQKLDAITLRGLLRFDRLMIYAADDPSAVIALRGEVEMTPSGVRIINLDLVEPYPLKLVAAARDALEQAASNIWHFLSELKPPSPSVPPDFTEGIRRLLDVLGRLAAAIGRAAVFVGELAGDAVNFVGQALHGIAEAIGRLMSALAELLADTAKAAHRYLAFEVRISSDSFEVRQVLVTLRRDEPVAAPSFDRVSALGFDLEIPIGWEPGLLLDFVASPGAYLIATRQEGAASEPFATLSTDLWLKRKGDPVQPMRDANGASGERGQSPQGGKPLFSVAAKLKDPGEFALILAGLHQGQGVFFKKIKSVERKQVLGVADAKVVTANGAFAYEEIDDSKFEYDVEFEKDRVLPLLGMGEPGKEASSGGGGPAPGGFLDRLKNSLAQTVWVKRFDKAVKTAQLSADATLVLGIKAAGVETEILLKLKVDLRTFQVSFDADTGPINLKSKRIEERALGLLWVVEQRDEEARRLNTEVEMFKLDFKDGETGLALNQDPKTGARMEVRFTELSSDGVGVVLNVESFGISRAGLDLSAKASGKPVRLNGLDVPFQFTTGEFVIRGGRVSRATIGGRGSLPRDLVGEVDCAVLLDFKQDASSNDIVLQSGKVEFGKKGEPIVCHSTRFTLTINDLDIAFARDGGYHFYFLVTGSLEFTPRDGEFDSGLLQYLKDVRIDLERAPLTADPRVLMKHVKFQKSLNPKKTFPLFNLFQFELRGFGFHPASPKFGGSPAVNVSGQIKFAQIGDVMQPSIEFHGLWIAPPEAGKSLPRVKADGLGIDIGLSGVAKLRGSVLAVDPQTPSLEGLEFAPPGYDAYGFLGEGQLSIEGWGTMSASMGFMEVARKETPDDRKKSFFLFLEANKLAVEIPVVVWTFYLREVGFGFGYRYTLRGIKDAEAATSTAKLVKTLDEVSKRQGDLSRFTSWLPDPEGDNVTLALRGAFQCYPAQTPYDDSQEENAAEPFFFDIVAALRSDMTFLMAARGWVATNYSDFLNDKTGEIRNHPGFRGYLFISAPRMELLARCIGDSTGYVGDRLGNIDTLKSALKSVDWSMTLYINPRLFHLELGWPDQLVARLRDEPNFRVIVRGGMIFRVAEDGILWGFNIEADAFIAFSGSVGGGSIGVAIEASIAVKFIARLIAFLSWRVKGSLIYALISLDINLSFRVRAWMEIDLGIKSITIRISFSFHVQFSAAVELAISTEGVGARVVAPIAIPAFGCMLWVTVKFTIGGSKLEEARARVQRFMALGITNETTPDPVKSVAIGIGDKQVDKSAQQAEKAASAPLMPTPTNTGALKPPTRRSVLGSPIEETQFWLVMHASDGSDDFAYALLVPKEPVKKPAEAAGIAGGPAEDKYFGGFYCSPRGEIPDDPRKQPVTAVSHVLSFTGAVPLKEVKRWDVTTSVFADFDGAAEVKTRWDVAIPSETDDGKPPAVPFVLAHLFDECFLYDTEWLASDVRATTKWTEPPPLRHGKAEDLNGLQEDARKSARHNAQRDRAASASANPLVTNVYEARSTVLSMFLDQFVSLAKDGGKRSDMTTAHVTDLGLVFYGPVAELQKLAEMEVKKVDAAKSGRVEIFNPRDNWFDRQDPILQKTKEPKTDAAGIKIDWRLQVPFVTEEDIDKALDKLDPRLDAEQFLHHYEVTAEIDDRPRWEAPKRIKPARSQGGVENGVAQTLHPDWQFVDDLSDLPDELRQALLPASGEENALAAAAAWARNVGNRQEVTLTYSIVPVDIAGTRGAERSFIVEVPRPQSPIRPAEAELRFFVKPLHEAQAPRLHPKNLGIVLALRDPAWDDDKSDLGNGLCAVRRYRLIVDPEEVVPSGNYGSDGLTDRLQAPHSTSGQSRSGDEVSFTFDRENISKSRYDDTTARLIEPDDEARRRFVDGFLHLAGTPVPSSKEPLLPKTGAGENNQEILFRVLWGRDANDLAQPRRAASRFYLETLVSIEDSNHNPVADPFVSRRVHLNFEIVIENPAPPKSNDQQSDPVLLRPDAFEWPVRLNLPPLGQGQVRAATGFAMFRAPDPEATLETIVGGSGVAPIRDPERRVLTMVEWDAVPDWAMENATAAMAGDLPPGTSVVGAAPLPDRLHAATLGGFDLHELDIDDLSAVDTTTGKIKDEEFNRDAQVWRRARRVARVQLLPGSSAMLIPHTNDDLLGWHAHYPSDTWRIQNRQGAPGEHKPIKHGWWSPREATPRFPNRIVRRRLLPLSDEIASSALMLGGRPKAVYAKLEMVPKSPAETTIIEEEIALGNTMRAVTLADVSVTDEEGKSPVNLAGRFVAATVIDSNSKWNGWTKLTLKSSGEALTAADLRALQLCLAWYPDETVRKRFASDVTGLNGLVLKLAGATEVKRETYSEQTNGGQLEFVKGPPESLEIVTGTTDVPLSFGMPLHAALEEALAELELCIKGSTVYRRFKPVVQPAPRIDAKDLAGFLAATAPAKDPYGWGVLQSLGLSITIRLFDADRDAFVEPERLLRRVNHVMEGVIERYQPLMDAAEFRNSFGAPFAEVLLRPGKDRIPAPFDAKVPTRKIPAETSPLDFDHALAMVQLSLRPCVEAVWRYHRFAGFWTKSLERPVPIDGKGKFDAGAVFVLTPDPAAAIDVFRPADGRALELKPAPPPTGDSNKKPAIPTIGPPVPGKDVDPNLTLIVRVRRDFNDTGLKSNVGLGVIERDRTVVVTGSPPKDTVVDKDTVVEQPLDDWISHPTDTNPAKGLDLAPIAFPGAAVAGTPIDPFERFEPKNAEQWSNALLGGAANPPATEAFEALRRAVLAALPQMKWPPSRGGSEPPEELKSAVAVYLDWAQRFLDYGADPKDPALYKPKLHVAFAAPSKATPWRLAAALDGTLSVSFLHADRWGHARAYAVKPFGRYQELMIGANAYAGELSADRGDAREQLEQLISGENTVLDCPLGYAVAVSPRTERIEAPVILGSRIIAEPKLDPDTMQENPRFKHNAEWQIVVPRHNEESLAFSNRPLFARLGWEGIALSFVRDYREPKWPERLKGAIADGSNPTPKMHPTKEPANTWLRPSNTVPAITGDDLGGISKEFPSLWKGADIYRAARLPHYYRVSVLAAARAGIAVSPVSITVQEDFHATMLSNERLVEIVQTDADRAGKTAIVMQKDTARAALEITLPLLSYVDLMDDTTRKTWVDGISPTENVAWWPDPEVVYAFQRRIGSGDSQLLEEEAELRLVARAAPDAVTDEKEQKPLVVRARGARFKVSSRDPMVAHKTSGEASLFTVALQLMLAPKASPLAIAALDSSVSEADIDAFNGDVNDSSAQKYALIATGFELTIDLKTQPTDNIEATVGRIEALAAALMAAAANVDVPDPGCAKVVLRATGSKALDWAKKYRKKELPSMPATPSDAVKEAELSARKFQISWPARRKFPLAVKAKPAEDCDLQAVASAPRYLALIDFPAGPLAGPASILAALDRAVAVARQTPIASKQLPAAVTSDEITAFNTRTNPSKTERYARIFTRHSLTLDLLPEPATEPINDFVDRLGLLASKLSEAAAAVPAADPSNVANFLSARGKTIADWVASFKAGMMPSPPTTVAEVRTAVGLPEAVPVWWPLGITFVLTTVAGTPTANCEFKALSGVDMEAYLALFDLPTSDEVDDLTLNSGIEPPIAKRICDTLKRLATDLVAAGSENLGLRVVHPRAGEAGGVGVAQATIKWPCYFLPSSNGALQ